MKNKILVSCVILSTMFAIAHESHQQNIQDSSVQVSSCACKPIEHWFYKVCVQNYMNEFPEAGLKVSYDTEGLPENVVQAIEILAANINFLDNKGELIVPTISAKGNIVLSMGKNILYKKYKLFLHTVNLESNLSGQELYEEWMSQLD